MRKHKVNFYSPGTLFAESTTRPIEDWDVKEAVKMGKSITERHSAKPYGFSFSTVLHVDPVSDGEGGTLEVQPKTVKTSGIYFLGGTLETFDQVVARNDPEERILRSNMEGNEHWIVCVNTNSWKATIPFDEDSFVVDSQTGDIVERGDDPKYVVYRQEQNRLKQVRNEERQANRQKKVQAP